MKSLMDQNRAWLAEQLAAAPRGARVALAQELGIRPDALSRMTGAKESRDITLDELHGMARFFKADPPGLIQHRKDSRVGGEKKTDTDVRQVPLLDMVAAGKLKAATSQIPIEDVPLLAFTDLGRGDFFALRVSGDSMDRISPDGSTIVVNRADRQLVNGKAYVFSRRGEATFKLWRPDPARLAPYSTNPTHEPIFAKDKADAEGMVIGRVRRSVLDL